MAEPTSDIITGINPVEVLNMQHDTEARFAELFKPIDTTPPDITKPQLPNFHSGTINPGENINIDKNSDDYQLADMIRIGQSVKDKYPDSFTFQPDIKLPQSTTRRYIDEDFGYKIDIDNEDFYAHQQGTIKEIAKALFVKLPTYTFAKLGTGVGYLLGLVDPTNWGSGYIAKAGDNVIANAFSSLEDNLKNDWLTTYRYTVDQNKGFFERAATDLSFWTEDFTDGAAFLASAFVPGMLASKLALGTKIARGLQLVNGTEKAEAFLNGMAKFSSRYGDRLLTTAVNTASESMFEAKQVRDDVFSQLMSTGKYTEEEANKISAEKAKNTFLWNGLALSFSNLWETNLFFKAMGKGAPSKIQTKLTSLLEDYAGKESSKKLGKVGYYGIKGLQGVGVEGFYEENIQLAIQRVNEGKNTYKGYIPVLNQWLGQTNDALRGDDKEASENIGMGALIGLLFGTGTSIATKEYSKDRIATERLVAALNEAKNNWLKVQDIYTVGEDGKLKEDKAKVAAVFLNQMKIANDLSDAEAINHPILRSLAQKEIFSTFVASHVQLGSFDLLMKQLDDVINYKPKDLVRLGFDPKGDVAAQVLEYKEFARKINGLKKSLDNSIVVTDPKDLARKNYLFNIGTKQIALEQELNKVDSTISSLQSEIGYSSASDSLVDDLNIKKVKIDSQKRALKNAKEQEDKDIAQKKIDQYQSSLDTTIKDNEEAIKGLKKDKHGFFLYENDKKNKHPRIGDLGEQIYFKSDIENTIDDLIDNFDDTSKNKKKFDTQYEDSIKSLQEELKKEAEKRTAKAEAEKKEAEVKKETEVKKEAEVKKEVKPETPIVQSSPEAQKEKYDYFINKIPSGKNINVNLLNRLTKEINEASLKGEISEDQELELITMLQVKNPIGTLLDTAEDFEEPERKEKIVTAEKPDDVKENGFNPDTNEVQDVTFEEVSFSALAYKSSNKTVTQEEVEREGSYIGILDEDPYKVFKQGFLRYLILNDFAKNQYKGVIVKDKPSFPRDRGSAQQTELGYVLLITDLDGNTVYFDKDYNPSLEKTPGFQEVIYSFNKVAFKDLELARAMIGEKIEGVSAEEWMLKYEREEQEREMARTLVDMGMSVPISISGISAGMMRQGMKPIDAKIALADQKYIQLYIPQSLEAYDIKDPQKNKYIINIDGQNLINGAVYIQTQRSDKEPAVYTRIIPNLIKDNSKLFEDLKALFLHRYKDENEANIVKTYLKKVLFLGYINRPTIIKTYNPETDDFTLDLFEDGKVIEKPDVVQFIADQRLNISKSNINSRFDYYSIKDKKLNVEEIQNYNDFIIENSKTRARNIETKEGKVLMNINTYMMFTFDQGLETMKAIAEGRQDVPKQDDSNLEDKKADIERRRQGLNGVEEIIFSNPNFRLEGFEIDGNYWNVVTSTDRAKVLVNVNGVIVPFYLTTGQAGKGLIPGWYPFFGIGKDGWLNKTDKSDMETYYERYWGKETANIVKSISEELNSFYGTDPTNFKNDGDPNATSRPLTTLADKVEDYINSKLNYTPAINNGDARKTLRSNVEQLGKEINAKYDAELKALEQQPTTSNQSEIEAKKADIERRRQEELNQQTDAGYSIIALDYLFTGGRDVILSTDYLLQALVGGFTYSAKEINDIRNKYADKLGNIKDDINSDVYNQMMNEIRDVINKNYNDSKATEIFDKILKNATGFTNREGNQTSIELDKLNEQNESKINAKYDAELAELVKDEVKQENIAQLDNLPELIDKANKIKLSTQDKISLDNDPLGFFTLLKNQALDGNLAMMDKPENYGEEFMTSVLDFFNIKRDSSSLKKDPIKAVRRKGFEDVDKEIDEEAKNQKKREDDLFNGELEARVTEEEDNKLFITDSEIKEVNRMFGKEVARRIYGIVNSSAYGTWSASGIKLFENAVVGTGYHEAWHHFSQMYLTIDQKKKLYDEVRMRNIEFKTRDGRTLKSLKSTDFDIEEFLADDFRDYVLSDGKSRFSNRPYRNTLFRKIVDFIRRFFFGGINITKLYEELRTGNLNKYTPSINNAMFGKLNSSLINDLNEEIFDNKKAAYFRNVVDVLLGEELLDRNINITYLKTNSKLTEAVYKNIYNKLNDNYLNPLFDLRDANEPYNEELFDDLYKLTDNNNWNKFVNYHKKHSKLGLDIDYNIDTVVNNLLRNQDRLGEEDYIIEENEDDDPINKTPEEEDDDPENTANNAGDRSVFDFAGNEISSSDAATLEVKSLVRMLKKVNYVNGKFEVQYDINGFPRLNDFSHTWNNLASTLADLPTYEEMYAKLLDNQVQIKIPEVTELLKYLPHPNGTLTKLALAFRRDFNRSHVDIFTGKMTESNDFFFLQETKRNIDQIEKEWSSNFASLDSEDELLKGEVVLQDEDGRNYINPDITLSYNIENQEEREEFLKLIGFRFSDETLKNPVFRVKFAEFLKTLQGNINSRLKLGQKIYNPVYDLKQDIKNEEREIVLKGYGARINAFIAIESLYSSLNPSMSYQNAEGNTIYALTLNNFLTKTAGLINNAKSYDELISKREAQFLNYENNPYVKNSIFLNTIFNKDGSRNNVKLIVGNYNGLKVTTAKGTKAYATTSLNVRDKIIMDINSLLKSGKIEIMRTESSKTSYFVGLDKYGETGYLPVNIEQFSSGFNSPKFINIFKGYLEDELDRMKNADKITLENYPKEAAKQFNLFIDILRLKPSGSETDTERLKNKIKDDLKELSPKEVINQNKEDIEKAIIQFFEKEYLSFMELLSEEGIDREDIAISLNKFSTSQLLRTFVANDFILNIEYTKLFDGDTVFQSHYKDYHKRAKGAISTGHDPMVDGMFVRFMQSNQHNTIAGFLGTANLNDYITTKSLVLTDDKRQSVYVDSGRIEENLRKSNPLISEEKIKEIVEKYKDMNIADGQGHITLDFYRQFLLSIYNWSDEQEVMYRKELAWFRLNYSELNPEYTEEQKEKDRNFIKKYRNVITSFPPIKMQYNGPIEATGTYAQVMDKFSVAPLIPSIIQGTPFESLHIEMSKKGIGYSKFESGTKKFKYTSHSMYTESGIDTNISKYNPPVHFLQFLKEQINTKTKIEEDKESIFGSQIRKLIMANIFSNGMSSDKWNGIRDRYKSIIKNIRNFEKEKLFNELGLKDINGKIEIENLERFIESIQKQAELRSLNDNIKDYIQYDKDTKNIKYPLEASLNKKAIQALLMGIIDNRLRKQKVSGDMLIQISSSGFQSNDFKYKNALPEDILRYGTNGLRFYDTYTDKNGNTKTRGMQVKVSIIGFKNLLNKEHPDGNKIETIERLNALLKDDSWVEKNRDSITMIGYRIPTQGTNSIEFMEVAEFLPEIAGNIVIPPAEIVTKSGSDFDIDKLSVFRPSFDRFGNIVNDNTIIDLQERLDTIQNLKKIELLKKKFRITGSVEALGDVLEQENDLDLDVETIQLKKEISKIRNSRKQIYSNELIKLYSEILSDPYMYEQLITPNDTNLIKDASITLGRKIGKLSKKDFKINKITGEEKKEAYFGTQIYRYKNNLRKFDSLLSAKKLLGVFAVNNSFSQLLQQADIGLNLKYNTVQSFRPISRDVRLLLLTPEERDVVMKNGRINISGKYDVYGELKQNIFSQLINGTVDAASDDFLGYINLSFENIGVLNYLIHIGVPFPRAIAFLNQPIMLKYYSELKKSKDYKNEIIGKTLGNLINKSFYYDVEQDNGAVVKRFSGDELNKAINNILSGTTTKIVNGKKTITKIIPDSFSFRDNELDDKLMPLDQIDDYLNHPQEGQKRKLYQAAVFAYFISLQEQSQLFRNFQSVFNMDTTKMQNPMDAFRLIFKQSKILKDGLFNKEDITQIESDSIISPFINNKVLSFQLAKELMPYVFNPRLTATAARFVEGSIYAGKSKLSKLMGTIENDWIEYIIKCFGKINGLNIASYTNTLLYGRDSLSRRLISLRNKYPELLKEYSLFDRLRNNISNNRNIKQQNIEVQKLFEDTVDDQNRYIVEFRNLINFTNSKYDLKQQAEIRKFFGDLAILGFLQSGFNRSPISFQELIPYEQLADVFSNSLKTFKDNVESNPEILKKFVEEFINQFKSLNPTLISSKAKSKQSWRGKSYTLISPIFSEIQADLIKKSKLNQMKQLESAQFSELNPEIDMENNILLESNTINNIKSGKQKFITLSNNIKNGERNVQDKNNKNKTLVNLELLGQFRYVSEDDAVYKIVNNKKVKDYNPDQFAMLLGYKSFIELGEDYKMIAFSAGLQTRNVYKIEPLVSNVDNVPVQKENLNDEVEEKASEILPSEEKVVSLDVTQNQSQNIDFQEDTSTGYESRTRKNASADATLAIAVDFSSRGEILTEKLVREQGKKYIPIDLNNLGNINALIDRIVESLNSVNAKSINMAGNGIYTMKGKYSQEKLDSFVYNLLKRVVESPNLKNKITLIRSGGQTGIDEAGAKAGIKLGIPTIILAPKGWKFRNIDGKDISSERQFKARFNVQLENKSTKQLRSQDAKDIYKEASKIEPIQTARSLAMEYFIGGGKISPETLYNEVITKRDSRLVPTKQQITEEIKSRDYVVKGGNSIKDIAHSIWDDLSEEIRSRFDEQDIRDELISIIKDFRKRLDIAKEYMNDFAEKPTEDPRVENEEESPFLSDEELRAKGLNVQSFDDFKNDLDKKDCKP